MRRRTTFIWVSSYVTCFNTWIAFRVDKIHDLMNGNLKVHFISYLYIFTQECLLFVEIKMCMKLESVPKFWNHVTPKKIFSSALTISFLTLMTRQFEFFLIIIKPRGHLTIFTIVSHSIFLSISFSASNFSFYILNSFDSQKYLFLFVKFLLMKLSFLS